MAHAQKSDFFLRPKRSSPFKSAGGRQFSRLLAAEVCASAVVMLDTPCSEIVWRVLATHCIRQFPLQFPSRASPCGITFHLDTVWIIIIIIVIIIMFSMRKSNSLPKRLLNQQMWISIDFINYNLFDTLWQQYSTVHIYTQTIYGTTQLSILIGRISGIRTQSDQNNWEGCGPCPVFANDALIFAFQLWKKQGNPSVRVAEQYQLAQWKQNIQNRTYITVIIRKYNNKNTLLTPRCRVLLEKLTGLQLVKKFSHFTEPEGSLPHSQASATCLYPGPAQSSPYTHIPPPGDPS